MLSAFELIMNMFLCYFKVSFWVVDITPSFHLKHHADMLAHTFIGLSNTLFPGTAVDDAR